MPKKEKNHFHKKKKNCRRSLISARDKKRLLTSRYLVSQFDSVTVFNKFAKKWSPGKLIVLRGFQLHNNSNYITVELRMGKHHLKLLVP